MSELGVLGETAPKGALAVVVRGQAAVMHHDEVKCVAKE
jgi:hypothetical protein